MVLACGYEDPTSVSWGLLEFNYPDALYVVGAMSMAIAAGRLQPPNFDPTVNDVTFAKASKRMVY